MTKYDHIKALAADVGLQLSICADTYPVITEQLYKFWVEAYSEGERDMAEFANKTIEAAILAEREACAKECEEEAASWARLNAQDEEGYGAIQCAAAIRARGEK